MPNMLFANNANTTLASSLTNVATTMSVTSATGFPAPTGSQYFYCTLADAATQTTIEIVKVTAVSGTTFTITRGQDGTTGTAFSAGAVVSLRLVAASLNDFPKLDEVNTFTNTLTANSFIPSSSTVPTNGVYLPAANSVSVATSSTERIRFDSAGRLLAGTSTAPSTASALLTLNGGASGGGAGGFQVGFNSGTYGGYAITSSLAGGTLQLYTYTGAIGSESYTERLRFDTSGNLLVGTTTTLYSAANRGVLVLNGASTSLIGLSNGSSASTSGYVYWDGTNLNLANNATTGALIFGTNSATERMRIFGSGGVSIGNTTDPGATNLSVAGSINGSSILAIAGNATVGNGVGAKNLTLNSSTGSFILGQLTAGNSYLIGDTNQALGSGTGLITYVYGANPTIWYNNGAEAMRIHGSGGVSIGNTTDAGAGNLRFNTRNTNGILFGTASTSVLSDYETGTWTPNQGSGLTVVGTFSSAGTYTKIGRVVTITFFVNGSTSISLAGGSALVCTNMPYAAAITSGSAFFGTGANGYNTAAANVQFYQNAIYSVQSLIGTGGIYVSGTFNV